MLKRKRDSFGKDGRIKRLEYRALSNATGRFSNANKIGEGGFGVVYKGKLGRREVAVNKILKDSGALLKNKHDSNGEFKDFLAEVGTIGEMGHMNVVRLEGWCCNISNYLFWCFQKQKVQLFIVYELVPNGNLEDHLYHREEALSWARRYVLYNYVLRD
jgi:serine/threonine protein kinase